MLNIDIYIKRIYLITWDLYQFSLSRFAKETQTNKQWTRRTKQNKSHWILWRVSNWWKSVESPFVMCGERWEILSFHFKNLQPWAPIVISTMPTVLCLHLGVITDLGSSFCQKDVEGARVSFATLIQTDKTYHLGRGTSTEKSESRR